MGLGPMELPKAPADITPAKFFMEWLPTQVDSFKDLIGQFGGGVSAAMATRVTGDGGGDWTTVLEGGAVKVEEGLRDDAVVTIVISAPNFKDAVTGQMEDVMQPPPDAGNISPEDAAEKAKQNMEAVKTIEGQIKFAIEDDAKPFEVMVKFAGPLKDEADVAVIVDREQAIAMAKGDTNPQAAFMSGAIKIEGDMGILMQLAPMMM